MVKRDSNFNPLGSSRGVRRQSGQEADWASVSGTVIISAIAAAAITGGALRFGYSRDGGAYAIGIYGDGEPYTEFVRPSEDVEQFLKDVEQLFVSLADAAAASAKGKKSP